MKAYLREKPVRKCMVCDESVKSYGVNDNNQPVCIKCLKKKINN